MALRRVPLTIAVVGVVTAGGGVPPRRRAPRLSWSFEGCGLSDRTSCLEGSVSEWIVNPCSVRSVGGGRHPWVRSGLVDWDDLPEMPRLLRAGSARMR